MLGKGTVRSLHITRIEYWGHKSGTHKNKLQLPLSRLITVSCLLCANDNNYTELMHAKMKLVYRRWNLDERSGNNWTLERPIHRVDRVLSFFSCRPNWDSPTPSPASECAPPMVPGGGAQSLVREEIEGPNSDEGIDTVVLYICIYVHCGLIHTLSMTVSRRNRERHNYIYYRELLRMIIF